LHGISCHRTGLDCRVFEQGSELNYQIPEHLKFPKHDIYIGQSLNIHWSIILHSRYLCDFNKGPISVVGIAIRYGLGGPWIESRWRRDFLHTSRLSLGSTQPPGQWVVAFFSMGKAIGAWHDHPSPLAPKLKKELYLCTGLWSQYTKTPTPTPTPRFLKLLTPTPRFLEVRLRLLHKNSMCINNGKPIRHFIATTWIIRLLLWLITYI
jgi:hypothetical protein